MSNLLERIKDLQSQAMKALEGDTPDLDKARGFRAEAERLVEVQKEMEAIKAISPVASAEPMRPPMVNLGGDGGSGPLVTNGSDKAVEPTLIQMASKAAYVKQYGDDDAVSKALLTDLHGSDYIAKYWAQKAAFNSYMRGRDLTRDEKAALSGVIYTPAAIQAALAQGVSDFKTLKSTMVEAADTLGGYLVPVDFQARVLERIMGYTVMRGAALGISTSRDSVQIPKSSGGNTQYTSAVRVTWVDESPTAGTAESNLTFTMETIPVHTAMIETPLSRNLLEDAAFAIEPYLAEKFGEAAAMDEDNQFLTGDGVGKPQGILVGSANTLSLTEANSGDATLLTWDGLITLIYSIDAQYRANARFIAEKATYQAIRKLVDGTGRYLWEPNQQVGQPLNLLGYPVYEQEGLPSIGANTYPIIFGDPKGYLIVDRVGMSVERFLDSATARTNSALYIMRRRLGGQVAEPWRLAVQKVSA